MTRIFGIRVIRGLIVKFDMFEGCDDLSDRIRYAKKQSARTAGTMRADRGKLR
jgi:hypothetical protein